MSAPQLTLSEAQLTPAKIVEEAMRIAAAICVYTNEQLTIEELAG